MDTFQSDTLQRGCVLIGRPAKINVYADPVDEKNAHTLVQIPEGKLALPALSKLRTQQSKPEKKED